MMSERKRKWILGTLLFLIVVTPIATLNNYTLDRVQNNIKTEVLAERAQPWMPVWQFRIAETYRYTLRDAAAADAFRQYWDLFYQDDRNEINGADGLSRAEEAVWDFAQVLESLGTKEGRYEAYLCLEEIERSWPQHPKLQQAQQRAYDLKKQGYDRPPY